VIGNATCLANGNKICLNTDGIEECGNCLNGYIAIAGNCTFIENIDFQVVLDLIDIYAPQFTSNATEEVRVQRLKLLCQVVSFLKSRIPPLPFQLDLNQFSMDTEEERQQRLGYQHMDGLDNLIPRFDPETHTLSRRQRRRRGLFRRQLQEFKVPDKKDHAADGAVTAVKDQGRCGCCWAVATAAAVESAAYLTEESGFLQSLSFQQMISCDTNNLGCNGGNIIYSILYAWRNRQFADEGIGGLATLNAWPYTDEKGDTTEQCDATGKNASVFLKEPYVVFSTNDNLSFEERKERMKVAATIQPVVMVLKSGCDLFSSYSGGIMTEDGDCACGRTSCLDHAVVLVGFDDTGDIPYWKLRNSWGTRWGERGYFRIASEPQGVGEWGLFGLLAEAAIPLQAYNTTAAEPDDSDDDLEDWAKILIIVVAAVVFCCLAGCIFKFVCR
jgi:hypothetical protein